MLGVLEIDKVKFLESFQVLESKLMKYNSEYYMRCKKIVGNMLKREEKFGGNYKVRLNAINYS